MQNDNLKVTINTYANTHRGDYLPSAADTRRYADLDVGAGARSQNVLGRYWWSESLIRVKERA